MHIQHFKKNEHGKDFVVGDIHGMFSLLDKELIKIGFDFNRDRLFAVGDLVDRGPESDMFWDYLRTGWFFSVKGNHEQMVIDSVSDEYPNAAGNHAVNGGLWLYGLPEVEQQCYAEIFKDLPLAIELETSSGLVGIIHAEVPLGDWDLFKSMYDSNKDRFDSIAMWARTKITSKDSSTVKGIDRVYVGHTPLNEVNELGNVIYIGTGGCFSGGKLTILEV